MINVRIENFRNGEWSLRGGGDLPATTPLENLKAGAIRMALNYPVRLFVNGDLVLEHKRLTARQAKQIFGL